MKRFTFIVCMSLLILLLVAAVPVTATTSTTTISGDVISSLSPTASQSGKTVTVTITGNNFTNTEGSVRLEKSGENDIDASQIDSWSASTIQCRFKISSSKATGNWNVVVVKGYDNTVIVKSGFGITQPMSLTSISPTSGQMDDNVDFSLVGTNLDDVENVYLYSKGSTNISADSDFSISDDGKKIKGTFDLSDADEGTYDVCVEDSYKVVKCDLSFEVTSNKVGTIAFTSSPSGASIYIDGIANGTTPNTVKNVIEGSHKVILKMNGYEEWGKIVNVVDSETSNVNANLNAISVSATAAPTNNPAPVDTATPTRTRTTVKSTVKVPTSWADTPTTTAASPVDPIIIIGTLGLAFLALRKP